jgi:hypothetical protein
MNGISLNPIGVHKQTRGSTLAITIVLGGILAISAASMLQVSSFRLRSAYQRSQWTEAYYHSENVLNWAAQKIADADQGGTNAPFLGQYSISGGSIDLPYLTSLASNPDSLFKNAWLTITNSPNGIASYYIVTASAKVGEKVRTLQMTIQKNPPSQVFDYEYFLNNWGWWWGSTITGNGDNRANWDFDFRDYPTINGSLVANGQIESNGNPIDPLAGNPPFHGIAGDDPTLYVHSGSPRLPMPNLLDLTYYKTKAENAQGKLFVGTNIVVNAYHNDTNHPGLYLVGTSNKPIKIVGPVVIPGDVILKGVVTGVGTLYVGKNLFLAGDVAYANSPDFSSPPSGMTTTNRDSWVKTAVNNQKDLVAFAVRESIFGGNPNSSDWKANCYDSASYGLNNVGDETQLGKDGIAHTPDDHIPFLDTDNDGVPDSAWYDADADGIVDHAYNYDNDIRMSDARAAAIANYPTNSDGSRQSFDSIASNNMNTVCGVFYSNHAIAMRLANDNARFHGSIICRNEAIIFNSTLKFIYDPRIHSRYSDDPNRYVDLGLPVANRVMVRHIEELTPHEGFGT